MGLVCSDSKRSRCIPTVERYCSTFTEISNTSCSVSFYTEGNQNPGSKLKKLNKLRKVTSHSDPAHLEYYDQKVQVKTRYKEKNMVTLTGLGRNRQTATISELKVTGRCSRKQVRFRKEGHTVGRTTGYSNNGGTLGWSTTSTSKVRSHDISHISKRILKRSSWEKREASLINRSHTSPAKEPKAKNCGAMSTQAKMSTNDSLVSLGYAANVKLSEIPALGECLSLPTPGEPAKQLVKNEQANILSDSMACPFSAFEDNKYRQKERSRISKDIANVSEHTSLKRLQGKCKNFQWKELRLEDFKHEQTEE